MADATPLRSTKIAARRLAEVIGVAAVYYVAARLGLLLAFHQTNASPVWAPSGIAFAAVLWFGYRIWPGILLGAFLANATVFAANHAAGGGAIAAMSAGIGIGNTVESLLGALLLRRFVSAGYPLDRGEDVVKFVVVAAVMCLASCTIGSAVLLMGGIASRSALGTIWFTWLLGDVAGVLVLTPLLLTWRAARPICLNLRARLEFGVLLTLLLTANQVVFGGWLFGNGLDYALAFTLLPFLMWAAFRFGSKGVTLATVLVTGAAVWGTIHGRGPFARATVNESLLLLQAFVGISTVTGLVLAAVLAERYHARTALQKAHDELKVRAAELEAANKELESFAYSVSHDLRAPLRASDGFSRILLEEYAPQLSPEIQRYLGLVRSNTKQMGQLVDDLLRFSRLSRQPLKKQPTEIANVARQCVEELRAEQEGRGIEFVLGELPACQADAPLLKQVLINLLGNALKYTRGRDDAVIEFGCRDDLGKPGERVYFIRDNGVGFDMKYAHKLFGVFQRLHRAEDYEGTGVGLAIVQRILHRHGGRIWAEAKVNEGAAFFFTLEGEPSL